MTDRRPTLDAEAIDAIHTRLLARYGARWINLWAGVSPEIVKADWLRELRLVPWSGVMHALSNLPDDPPIATRFKALCLSRPDDGPRRLPGPKAPADLLRLRSELERLLELRKGRHRLQWAYDLQERQRRGEPLTEAQVRAMDAALRGPGVEASGGRHSVIAEDKLPPGMRADAAAYRGPAL